VTRSSGRDQFRTALLLALGALGVEVVLQLALYARPSPYGGPFLVEWGRYLPLALYYALLGIWLAALPFFLLWLMLFRRPVARALARGVHLLQALLLALLLLLGAIDHEILRFLGVRLNASFLLAYAQPAMLTDRLFLDLLASDRGGPFVSLLLALVPAGLFVWWGSRLARREPGKGPALWLALMLALLPPILPARAWLQAGSQFRLRKVEPIAIALAVDARAGFEDRRAPADLDRLAAEHRHAWLARSTDPGWSFPDPAFPYWRVPAQPSARPSAPWSVIYIQLETFRGADMGWLRPDRRPSPTPVLDGLAVGASTAAWHRALSFGMPSINGLFATHCSIAPPSQRYITNYVGTRLRCLPERLRQLGYRTEMFNGGDTDWDNSSPWIARWYDRLWRFPEAEQRDREIFRAAAREIGRLGRTGRPFFASIVSVTNHTPFRSKEPALDIARQGGLDRAILNTTHYTDDVVGEFLRSLASEPWYDRTLVVIVGDHGFSLGEHGGRPGRQDLYRESVWVPLLIVGPHPRLPRGRHDGPASLLDVAPTIADLIGLREAVPWQGHSLLAVNRRSDLGFGFRDALLAEHGDWSAVRDPQDGAARLYRRTDWLQQRDLARESPGIAAALLARAERRRRLNDHLLRADRIMPAG
jgi:hypothetical protein